MEKLTLRVHPRGFTNEFYYLCATGTQEITEMKKWDEANSDDPPYYSRIVPNTHARDAIEWLDMQDLMGCNI